MKTMEEFINFWVNGVLTCVVVICGIFLNSVSIHIIRKKYSKSSIFYQMLLRLLCIDICVLVTWFAFSLYVAFKVKHIVLLYLISYGIYPLIHVALSASTFMTIAMSHERYQAVKYPVKYGEDMRAPHVLTRRLWMYTITVISLSVIYNLTYFFELGIRYHTVLNNSEEKLQILNSTIQIKDTEIIEDLTTRRYAKLSNSIAALDRTNLGRDEDYLYYYKLLTRLMISGIIPFALLTYFDIEIFRAIKRNNRLRRRSALAQPMRNIRRLSVLFTGCKSLDSGYENASNSIAAASSKQEQKRQQEDNLAKVFVVMVVAFLFCNGLKFGLNFYDGIIGKNKAEEWYRIISYFSNLLVLFNSSMNMIIYCIMNHKFREDLFALWKNFRPMRIFHKPSFRSRQTSRLTSRRKSCVSSYLI